MDIRILPSNIANLIAAGEVVQRPASVVKELMENALDAGATQVTVVISDSGRTLIQVIDNGCGMSPDQAVLCFERHATSKISSAEDLQDITTFGFRGEALASIAAVAEVTLKTRRQEDVVGCQVEFADSKHLSTEEIACPQGANFAVRNLFYNVPARRKFLKSDAVELKHIVEEFTRVALTRPDVGFTLSHNGRDIHVLRPAKSHKYRIQDLLGSSAVDKVVDIAAETSVVSVNGYVCRPDLARKTVGNQFFFVNGRYFRSPYLHKAVMRAYEGMVSEGAVPSYFIWLKVDPRSMDVNIHPTKTEIKFEDDSVIFQVLSACIREALGRNSFGGGIDFEQAADAPEMPVFGKKFDEYRPEYRPDSAFQSDYNPFETGPGEYAAAGAGGEMGSDGSQSGFGPGGFGSGGYGAGVPGGYGAAGEAGGYGAAGAAGGYGAGGAKGQGGPEWEATPYGTAQFVKKRDDYGKLFEDKTLPSSAVMVLQGRFIAAQAKSGLLLVHVRRAWERVLYERFLKAFSASGHVSQTALFPVQVNVGVEARLTFDAHEEMLSRLGFDIAPFGNDTIVVNGVPEGFSCDAASVESLMADVLIALDEDNSSLPGMMESAMARKFARIGASRGQTPTTAIEAQRLIDALFSCSNSEYTSDGHRILTILSLDEIEKRF